MARKNDEAMALADVYAESLFLAAEEQGRGEAVAQEFADLIRYMDKNPEFDEFLIAASIDDDPRRESLEKLFRGRMNDLLLNLLQVLNNRGRCSLIRDVQRCLELRIEAKHRQQEVVVETAMPLTDDLRAAIERDIGERIGKEVLLVEEVEPDLIGGLVIHVGDVQIDASVASQIRSVRKRLTERAMEEIQSGRGYVVET